MNRDAILDIFREKSALLEGHFKLSSGLHSDTYLQCALVLQEPATAERLCRELATRWEGAAIDVVVGPALGAVVMAHEMARALGVRGIFMERREGELTLRRGFTVSPQETVLVVEDVVTTGGSAAEILRKLEPVGCTVAGVSSLVNRSGSNPFATRFESLLEITPKTWQPARCPLCAEGRPLETPGSRQTIGS